MATETPVDRKNVDSNDSETEVYYSNEDVKNRCIINNENHRNTPLSSGGHRVVSSSSCSQHASTSIATPPPDGGWGWVIVFASFMVNLIADGVSLSFGVLFVELVKYFGESKAKTSWVGSIFFSMPLLAGPIASYLSDRYGCRKVCIAGALLSTGAFIVSTFATTLEVLFLTFTIAGLGLALCYVTSIVVVAYYFEKKRSLATGLSSCGTGIGTFVFPPLTMYLLKEYNWQGSLLILSGFFLNMVAFGALMRDLDSYSSSCKSSHSSEALEPDNSTLEDSERLCSSLVQLPTYLRENVPFEVITEISNKEGGYLSSLLQQHPYLLSSNGGIDLGDAKSNSNQGSNSAMKSSSRLKKKIKYSVSNSRREDGEICRDNSATKFDSGYLRNMRFHRGSLTYRNAMLNIRRYRLRASSCPDIYRNSMMTISDDKSCACFADLKELLLDMFDLTIFKNIQYTLFCFSNFLLYACIDVPYVYIPDLAQSLNFDNESASYLISFLGVLNTFGVVIVGYVGDKTWLDSSMLYSGFIIISGLLIGVIPLVSDYYGLASLCGIYGFTISANYTLVPVITVNLISLDSFTGAYGMLLLVQGIATLAGPPLAGMLFDMTGNYDITFFTTGLCIVVSGLMVIPFGKLFCRRKSLEPVGCSEMETQKQSAAPISKVRFEEHLARQSSSVGNDIQSKSFFAAEALDSKNSDSSVTVPFLPDANGSENSLVKDLKTEGSLEFCNPTSKA